MIEMLWHYTVGQWIPMILESGVLRLATDLIHKNEKPAIWFSSREDWEPTAVKGTIENGAHRTLTFEEMVNVGMYRVGVSPDVVPHNWEAFIRLGRAPRVVVEGLEASAINMGASPADWWVSFEPVPRSKWKAVHRFVDGVWIDETEDLLS